MPNVQNPLNEIEALLYHCESQWVPKGFQNYPGSGDTEDPLQKNSTPVQKDFCLAGGSDVIQGE
jgi:hypothetical protein